MDVLSEVLKNAKAIKETMEYPDMCPLTAAMRIVELQFMADHQAAKAVGHNQISANKEPRS